jgi:hypothetical protein
VAWKFSNLTQVTSMANRRLAPDSQGTQHHLRKTGYSHVIALVHGIRDIGAWQHSVSCELESQRGVRVVQIRYGLFSAWRFLCPLPVFFGRPTRRVVTGLNNLRSEYPNAKISVIAHSFGTFLLLRALKNDPLIQLWKVVFCGSVADDLANWSEYRHRVGDGKRPTRDFIVNDCGTGDWWPVLGRAFGWFYGMAGTVGFSEEYVTNRFHRGSDGGRGSHSLYFDRQFVAKYWKPFLIDDKPLCVGTGRQGEHLPTPVRALYYPVLQWASRLVNIGVWFLLPLCILLLVIGAHR